MVLGSWVGDPLPVLFCFPFCSSSPMSASVAWEGVECSTLCDSIPFLFFALLTFLSLAFMLADPTVAGFTALFNK